MKRTIYRSQFRVSPEMIQRYGYLERGSGMVTVSSHRDLIEDTCKLDNRWAKHAKIPFTDTTYAEVGAFVVESFERGVPESEG